MHIKLERLIFAAAQYQVSLFKSRNNNWNWSYSFLRRLCVTIATYCLCLRQFYRCINKKGKKVFYLDIAGALHWNIQNHFSRVGLMTSSEYLLDSKYGMRLTIMEYNSRKNMAFAYCEPLFSRIFYLNENSNNRIMISWESYESIHLYMVIVFGFFVVVACSIFPGTVAVKYKMDEQSAQIEYDVVCLGNV